MLTRLIVEVEPDSAGALPSRLITAAYHASCGAPVTLVLRGASADGVDRVLDPVVVYGRRDVYGVRYVDGSDRAGVMAAARTAQVGVGRTGEFRAVLAELGVPCFAPEDADEILGPMGARPVQAPVTAYSGVRSATVAASPG
jgi:hypothetical protein